MKKPLLAMCTILFLLHPGLLCASTWYVATNGNNSDAGISWPTAKATIQAAVDIATNGDTILVADGIYTVGTRIVTGSISNRVAISNAVHVQSVSGPHSTTILGGGSVGVGSIRCVYIGSNASLSGFTLLSGRTLSSGPTHQQSGGGAWCEQTGIISNCVIRGNIAYAGGGGVFGGTIIDSIVSSNSTPGGSGAGAQASTIVRCTVSQNNSYYGGGGCDSCVISNSLILDNTALLGNGGGALNSTLVASLLTGNKAQKGGGTALGVANRCRITRNTAWSSGGSRLGGGCYSNTLNNCFIADNSGNYGGGTYGSTLYNCTVIRNWAEYGGGIMNSTAINSIGYYNTVVFSGSNTFSSVWISSCTSPDQGPGNISGAPQFTSDNYITYYLRTSSPCRDVGSNDLAVTASDISGTPRIMNGRVDMGCHEYTEESVAPDAASGLCQWFVLTGLTYRLERSTNMQSWASLGDAFIATQALAVLSDTNGTPGAAYRCVLYLP